MNRAPSPAAVHWSIWWSPSELPKASKGRRPMNFWMATGLSSCFNAVVPLQFGRKLAGVFGSVLVSPDFFAADRS